jgi:hypothetical protein
MSHTEVGNPTHILQNFDIAAYADVGTTLRLAEWESGFLG